MAAKSPSSVCVRVVTWNVHTWQTRNRQPNSEAVIQVLRTIIDSVGSGGRAKLTVIALQEVPFLDDGNDELRRVAEELGLKVCIQTPGYFGNVILVDKAYTERCQELQPSERHIDEASPPPPLFPDQADIKIPFREARTITSVLLCPPCSELGRSFRFFNLHIDHLRETTRLRQMEQVFAGFIPSSTSPAILSTSSSLPYMIVGDFNCLNRADYSSEKWEKIVEHRKANFWELPETKLIEYLLNERKMVDCYSQIHVYPLAIETQPEHPHVAACAQCQANRYGLESCWVGTRVDYHFLSEDFVAKSGHRVTTHAFRTDLATKTEPSDHLPIVTEFSCAP